MGRIKVIVGLVVAVLVAAVGWQIGSWEVANATFQEEMRDLAAQAGTHIGFIVPKSDDEMREAVIEKAKDHGIVLIPEQVTVRRIGAGESTTMYLAAEYSVTVNAGVFAFHLRFAPSSMK
jgi:hypothetical protein